MLSKENAALVASLGPLFDKWSDENPALLNHLMWSVRREERERAIAVWLGSPDFEPTEAMLDAGLWHNHRSNSEANMIASFKAMLQQAEIDRLLTTQAQGADQ